MNEPIIQSNVNIDFKPAFDKPQTAQPSQTTTPKTSRYADRPANFARKSFSDRRHRSDRDPNLDSSQYVAHRYQTHDAAPVVIKPGETPVKI